MKQTTIKANLIEEVLKGKFDVIAHGCNTQSAMASGLAPQMVKYFDCNKFPMELQGPDINKLGCIDYRSKGLILESKRVMDLDIDHDYDLADKYVIVINAYTQAFPGKPLIGDIPLDYNALMLCFRKINYLFPNRVLGLPHVVGCGLAGGDPLKVITIIEKECRNLKEIIYCDIN